MKKLITASFILLSLYASAQKSKLLIGTYTSGKSEGIYVYEFDSKSGDSRYISSIQSSNPSYLAVSPDQKYVYAVNEDADSLNNGGAVSAYKFNKKKGKLSFINQQPSGGNHPCYVTVDNTGKWVIAGNYTGGSLSVLPVGENGAVQTAVITQHKGNSINKQRQEKAHVHQTVLTTDNRFILVPDLGMDKLMVYSFDNGTGKISPLESNNVSVIPGSGPRHVTVHPSGKYVYLTEELSGTVAAFRFNTDGKLKLMQTISAVPENYKGALSGADIHVSTDGKFLYSSNRGELNDIAIFSIDANTGILTAVGHQSSLGIKPRNFNFDPSGNFLLVANQDSDNIAVFTVNHETGLLTDTGKQIVVPNPVCIQWAK